jgi:hypothetical protein
VVLHPPNFGTIIRPQALIVPVLPNNLAGDLIGISPTTQAASDTFGIFNCLCCVLLAGEKSVSQAGESAVGFVAFCVEKPNSFANRHARLLFWTPMVPRQSRLI